MTISSAAPRPIYLDHHATTPVDPDVLQAMLPFFRDCYGNAGSINHQFGWEAAAAVDTARTQVAALLGCDSKAVVFTSGATESNNLAIKGTMQSAGQRRHLIVNAAEHRAVLDPAKRLKRNGFDVTVLSVDRTGRVDPQQVADAIRADTALVSVMLANNEVGTINDINAIGLVCRDRGVRFHVDAVQAVGWLSLDIEQLPVDLLSLSAHKIYGPKGIGALYVRRGSPRVRLEALIDGGGQEQQLRSGTLPVPLIVGLGTACEIVDRRRMEDVESASRLRDHLWRDLSEGIEGISLNGPAVNGTDSAGDRLRLPGNLNVSIPNVDGEALMTGLKRIAVSSGSACTSVNPEPSHVLRALGLSDSLTRSSLRFGLGRGNTQDDITIAVREVQDVVQRIQKRSFV
ncbi:MAG: cysteine desulfurase family protein [Planctomycetota bacterium]|nr:cysteine desulfurase family protein [Planctomycetota bacterium]